MTLNTIHLSLKNWMMRRKVKFSLHIQMALQAGLGVLAGIYNVLFQTTPPAQGDMFAARSMTGFTSLLPGHPG